MRFFSAFVEKTFCYPFNHLTSRGNGQLFFQARGDGLYPLIKDGDLLHIQQATLADLHAGDLVVLECADGRFAIWSVRTNRNRVNGDEEPVGPNWLVGRIIAIDRDGRTRRRDDRSARRSHIIYFRLRPLISILLMVRKIVSLIHPKFFVGDPASSLRAVADKYNDAKEVLYYSQQAFEGLDEDERFLLDQFMTRRGRVLNIGCGAGREAFALAEVGFEVMGIDVSPPMIAEAKRHAQMSGIPVHFEVKDATALDYPPNSFDYVLFSASVYSHIPTRQLRIQTLRKIHDLLTPSGVLFFSVEYRGSSVISRIFLHDALRRFLKAIFKERLQSEPGDILVPHVSPAGTPSKLCYFHLYEDAGEVQEEISSANLEGTEDEKSGYWIVRALKEDSSKSTILREVAA